MTTMIKIHEIKNALQAIDLVSRLTISQRNQRYEESNSIDAVKK